MVGKWKSKSEGNWEEGKRNGIFKGWYPNGNIQGQGNWKAGKKNGIHERWYRNGQLNIEANYKDNQLLNSKCYTEDGLEIECTKKMR